MPAKITEELDRQPIRFYRSDLDWVRSHYPKYGYNRLVRNLLRRFRLAVERREQMEEANDRERESTEAADLLRDLDDIIGESGGDGLEGGSEDD